MDILSEVLHVLQFKSTIVRKVIFSNDRPMLRAVDSQYALNFLLRGTAEIHNGEERFGLRKWDGVWFGATNDSPTFSIHAGSDRTLLLCVEFTADASAPHPLMADLAQPGWILHDALSDGAELGRVLTLLDEELANERVGSSLVSLRLAEVLLVEMLRRRELAEYDAGFLAALRDPVVAKVVAQMHADPGHRWNLVELSGIAGLTTGAFGERFQRQVGQPPLTYLRHWRLQRGKARLTNSGQPVRVIAQELGYASAGGFSRAFRKQFGQSPTAFRFG